MFCDFCINAKIPGDKSAFIKDCGNLKLETLKKHETSSNHISAANKYANEKEPTKAPAFIAKMSLNKAVYDKLAIIFRTVHAINIQAQPARDYLWMNELDTMKGILDSGTRYTTNEHKCVEFASAIADIQRQDIQDRLSGCKFISVIVDGSMDSSSTDNEMVYIQGCQKGTIATHFISCCQVERGTASQILEAIKKATETVMEWDDFQKKLVALGSDGASVMLGKNNGVIALLQKIQPATVAVHCSGHRLELAYKDAIKKVAVAEKVVTLLSGLYYIYRNSALNRTNFKNAFQCLGLKKLIPTRAGGTRWVGHTLHALGNFLNGYPALRLHLEQLATSRERSDSKSKAVGFVKLLRSKEIISTALFLKDILTVLHKVSLKFQEEGSVVADVSLTMKTALKCVESLGVNDGPCLQKLSDFETCKNPCAGATTRDTYKLSGDNSISTNERRKLISLLCKNLETRFEDTNDGLISSTSVANFKIWPDKEEQVKEFGNKMVKDLVEHYVNHFENPDQVIAEWPLLRTAIFEIFAKQFETLTWQQVNRRFEREYPHALGLFDLILSIPATSSACERGFTHMKLIKSNRRTHLWEKQLSNCLMIKPEGPSIKEFNPDRAINLWFERGHRRPGKSDPKGNKVEEQVLGSETSTVSDDVDADDVEMNNMYELVQKADDSDYGSDYNTDDDDENEEEIFEMIAKY